MTTNDHLHSFRLPTAEFHALEQAARAAGESLSGFIRKAIQHRITPPRPVFDQVNAVYSPPAVQYGDCVTWTENTSAAHAEISIYGVPV